MKKINKLLNAVLLLNICFTTSCNGNSSKVIKVCASDVPHAEVLEGCVKDLVKEKGYSLEVTILDWTMQNDEVANKDYDANYFQHIPYLSTYEGTTKLFASCKVHYEPLGIYYGKATNGDNFTTSTFCICDDESNAIRALSLLEAKGLFSKESEGDNYPINDTGDKLTFTSQTWTSNAGAKVNLIPENMLVASKQDYDFALLPCNTAYTGNVSSESRYEVENDPAQVSNKANVIAARLDDYKNDATYKAKIDILTDAMLSKEVAEYFYKKYLGAMTCDSSTQIDLRNDI